MKTLSLCILRRFAGALKTVLLALFYAGIPGEQTFLAKQGSELLIRCHQSSGYAVASSFGLSRGAAAGYFNLNVVLTHGVRSLKRLLNMPLVFQSRKKFLVGFAVNSNHALAREQLYLGDGALALACAMVECLSSH